MLGFVGLEGPSRNRSKSGRRRIHNLRNYGGRTTIPGGGGGGGGGGTIPPGTDLPPDVVIGGPEDALPWYPPMDDMTPPDGGVHPRIRMQKPRKGPKGKHGKKLDWKKGGKRRKFQGPNAPRLPKIPGQGGMPDRQFTAKIRARVRQLIRQYTKETDPAKKAVILQQLLDIQARYRDLLGEALNQMIDALVAEAQGGTATDPNAEPTDPDLLARLKEIEDLLSSGGLSKKAAKQIFKHAKFIFGDVYKASGKRSVIAPGAGYIQSGGKHAEPGSVIASAGDDIKDSRFVPRYVESGAMASFGRSRFVAPDATAAFGRGRVVGPGGFGMFGGSSMGPDGAIDPALLDPSMIDPSLLDPALLDPSLVDPALYDPSLWFDPSVLDPTLVDPYGLPAYDWGYLPDPNSPGADFDLVEYPYALTPVDNSDLWVDEYSDFSSVQPMVPRPSIFDAQSEMIPFDEEDLYQYSSAGGPKRYGRMMPDDEEFNFVPQSAREYNADVFTYAVPDEEFIFDYNRPSLDTVQGGDEETASEALELLNEQLSDVTELMHGTLIPRFRALSIEAQRTGDRGLAARLAAARYAMNVAHRANSQLSGDLDLLESDGLEGLGTSLWTAARGSGVFGIVATMGAFVALAFLGKGTGAFVENIGEGTGTGLKWGLAAGLPIVGVLFAANKLGLLK